ncbi:MAG: nucleotidyltransferase domain-containing protein [archaeon]|nr:nucleotidyltransferase domain-containing protein [archaeon]
MNIKKLLKEIDFSCPEEDVNTIKEESKRIVNLIREGLKKKKLKAEVFIGGSFAKGTLVRSKDYDVDIFVRFEDGENISNKLEKSLLKNKLGKVDKIHGSRDYFAIKQGKFVFEIIPVKKISKPKEMENVTDISYFHVNYAKRKINKKLAREIAIAKAFCKAHGIYGAESYIQGFSGYALECLIIHYKTFEKMIRELVKVKDQLILDPEKMYKKQQDIKVNINQSKLQSPVVLVDPTWKERNVLAALSRETFEKFQKAGINFLKNPNESHFEIKKINLEDIKKKARGKEFVNILITTDRQEGDIAGTKMKKFSEFLIVEMKKYFDIEMKEFVYDEKKTAELFVIAKSKKEIVRNGPPADFNLKKAVESFKRANKNVFEKDGRLYARIKINFTLSEFMRNFSKKETQKIKEMGITNFVVI